MADTFTSIENPRDWRGVPIKIDATCIYGAPVGRSIAMVEATVVGFTKSGRVNVRPVRRAYGSSASWGDSKEVVHVGQDRLTIVTELPPSELPREDELRGIALAEKAEGDRIQATHADPWPERSPEEYRAMERAWQSSWSLPASQRVAVEQPHYWLDCPKCGLGMWEARKVECAGST